MAPWTGEPKAPGHLRRRPRGGEVSECPAQLCWRADVVRWGGVARPGRGGFSGVSGGCLAGDGVPETGPVLGGAARPRGLRAMGGRHFPAWPGGGGRASPWGSGAAAQGGLRLDIGPRFFVVPASSWSFSSSRQGPWGRESAPHGRPQPSRQWDPVAWPAGPYLPSSRRLPWLAHNSGAWKLSPGNLGRGQRSAWGQAMRGREVGWGQPMSALMGLVCGRGSLGGGHSRTWVPGYLPQDQLEETPLPPLAGSMGGQRPSR